MIGAAQDPLKIDAPGIGIKRPIVSPEQVWTGCASRVRKLDAWPTNWKSDWLAWKKQMAEWKLQLIKGVKSDEEIRREAQRKGVKPMPLKDQMQLQWRMITAGLMKE